MSQKSDFLIVNCYSVAAAYLSRAGMFLPVMRQYGGRRFEERNVAVFAGRTDASWPGRSTKLACPDVLTADGDPVEFEGRFKVNENSCMDNKRQRTRLGVLKLNDDTSRPFHG